MKKILFSKQIHSGFSSASSEDAFLNIWINTKHIDFNLNPDVVINSKNVPILNGEKISEIVGDDLFTCVYLSADETFYNKALSERNLLSSYSKSEDFANLVERYTSKGWSTEKSIPEQIAYWKREEEADSAERREEGYVLWQKYEDLKKSPKSVYQGGFSDELFNNDHLQQYLSGPTVFGYIGNFSRKAYLDDAIEAGLRKRNLSLEKIANWLTSTDGRHFADHLGSMEKETQLQIVESELNRIFNIALIYSSPFHKGTLESTEEIRKDYSAQGILLPEDNTSYNPEEHFKILNDFFKLL